VLYLGEINDSQELAWGRSIEVLEDGAGRPRTLSLFSGRPLPQGLLADASIVGVKHESTLKQRAACVAPRGKRRTNKARHKRYWLR
jgi:hypothetical protein